MRVFSKKEEAERRWNEKSDEEIEKRLRFGFKPNQSNDGLLVYCTWTHPYPHTHTHTHMRKMIWIPHDCRKIPIFDVASFACLIILILIIISFSNFFVLRYYSSTKFEQQQQQKYRRLLPSDGVWTMIFRHRLTTFNNVLRFLVKWKRNSFCLWKIIALEVFQCGTEHEWWMIFIH